MRPQLSLLFLALVTCSPKASFQVLLNDPQAVIYEADSRQDVSLSESTVAPATAVLFAQSDLSVKKGTGNEYTVNSKPLHTLFPLCENEKFQEQPVAGHCSGVLVSANKILTAAHCVKDKNSCAQTLFTFGRNLEKATQDILSASDVYSCKKIVTQVLSTLKGLDYAVIELDRPVTGITPVTISKAKTLRPGDPVLSYSYPLGLPLKRDIGKILEPKTSQGMLRAAIDTFEGSSGSPLYDSQGQLIGILSSGADDFLEDDIHRVQSEGGCINFNRCKTGVCFGESYFTQLELVLQHL